MQTHQAPPPKQRITIDQRVRYSLRRHFASTDLLQRMPRDMAALFDSRGLKSAQGEEESLPPGELLTTGSDPEAEAWAHDASKPAELWSPPAGPDATLLPKEPNP